MISVDESRIEEGSRLNIESREATAMETFGEDWSW
jgi:hypothetical protein